MSSSEFDIIFRGDIVFGHQLADVKLKLQQLFKTDAAKVDALFTGRPVPLKRNLDEATANKYRDALMKAGAIVELCASDNTSTTTSQNKPAAPATTVPKVAAEWTLAPVGTYLIPLSSRQPLVPVHVDISALTLRPVGSNLLDAKEVKQNADAPVIVPNFDLAEVGADLVRADEKLPLPIVEFSVDDWELAELGSDLLTADEHVKVEPVIIDVSQFDLAPAGSDLGQLKPKVNALNPDISALSLLDPAR